MDIGNALGCLVWIIVIVCMVFIDEPWTKPLALVTGLLIVVAWVLGGGVTDRNDEQN